MISSWCSHGASNKIPLDTKNHFVKYVFLHLFMHVPIFSTIYHHDYFGNIRYTQNVHSLNTEISSSKNNSIEFFDLFLGIIDIFLVFLFEEKGYQFRF